MAQGFSPANRRASSAGLKACTTAGTRKLRNEPRLVAVLAILAAVAWTAAQSDPPRRHPAEARAAAAVSEADLRRHVRELVELGPRMGATPSGDRAAEYVQAFLEGLGLESRIETDPPKLAHWEESWSVELVPGGRLGTAWPWGYSPSLEATTAPLVVVPDLAGRAPEARWAGAALVTGSHPGREYDRLAGSPYRPVAMLTSFPDDPARYQDWSRIHHLPADPANPIPVFGLSFNEGRTVAGAAAAGASVRLALRSTIREGRPRTVIARLEGTDPSRYYLVCAHGDSDSGGPGADDNASGVATVLEVARVLAALARDAGFRPRASVEFAVWGSEFHSSRAYIDREGDRLRDLLGVINVDMVGTGAERETLYFESNDVPWNESLLRALEQVGEDYVGRPGFWPEYTTNPSQGGTDSYAFLPPAYKGRGYTSIPVPATTVFTAAWDRPAVLEQTPGWESRGLPDPSRVPIDYSRYYHSSGDTPENTTERTPQHMVRAARAIVLALLRLAS